MSVIVFELTEQHLNLLKHLRWSLNDKDLIVCVDAEDDRETPIPFGENDLYEAIDLILNGRPADFDPLKEEEPKAYTQEEKGKMDKIYGELPTALSIILYTGKFETGTYKTRYHLIDWKKQNV